MKSYDDLDERLHVNADFPYSYLYMKSYDELDGGLHVDRSTRAPYETSPPATSLAKRLSVSLPVPLTGLPRLTASLADSASPAMGSEAPTRAFAKLMFDDWENYMTSYAVDLGRDRSAVRALRTGFKNSRELVTNLSEKSSSSDDQAAGKTNRDDVQNMANEVDSETGSITGKHAQNNGFRPSSKAKKSMSRSSSSPHTSRRSSVILKAREPMNCQSLPMESLCGNAHRAQPASSSSPLPTPNECPFINICRTPQINGFPKYKNISRKHARIAFNFQRNLFELEIKGRNGAFIDDVLYNKGHVQALNHGTYVQIGCVRMLFVLPNVAIDEAAVGHLEASDSPLTTGATIGYESGTDQSDLSSSIDREVRELPRYNAAVDEDDDDEEEQEADDDDDDDDDLNESSADVSEEEITMVPQKGTETKALPGEEKELGGVTAIPEAPSSKRKGPGRPPKDGVMSKRQRSLLAKQAKEAEKSLAGEDVRQESPRKGRNKKACKVGGSDTPPSAPKLEKRKYTKRKPRAEVQQVAPQNTRDESAQPEQLNEMSKATKEKKPTRPPRSPSPEFDEATLTPEQLAKPTVSYVDILHEVLQNSKYGPMSLTQIYRAVQRRYPYFKVKAPTTGWQSSVRHNLLQTKIFGKMERDGKGWLWGIVPGETLEKERKRRSSLPPPPPPLPQQNHHPHVPPHPMLSAYPFSGQSFPYGQGPRYPSGFIHGQTSHDPSGLRGIPPRPPSELLPTRATPLGHVPATYTSPYQTTSISQPILEQPSIQLPTNTKVHNDTNCPPQHVSPDDHPAQSAQVSSHSPSSNSSPALAPAQSHEQHQPQSPAPYLSSQLPEFDHLSSEELYRIERWRGHLVKLLLNDKHDKVKAEAIVSYAIERFRNPRSESNIDSEFEKHVKPFIEQLFILIRGVRKKNQEVQMSEPSGISTPQQHSALDQHPSLPSSRQHSFVVAQNHAPSPFQQQQQQQQLTRQQSQPQPHVSLQPPAEPASNQSRQGSQSELLQFLVKNRNDSSSKSTRTNEQLHLESQYTANGEGVKAQAPHFIEAGGRIRDESSTGTTAHNNGSDTLTGIKRYREEDNGEADDIDRSRRLKI